ncbi:hypothetical protein F2Q68_00029901 [Brassica cretica]|uniref:Uncharacterized protein n=1 Tax=Brassica cretica TaxID=69181 RepID=A0A8S9G6J7_BRACR|nr:hypothetical protein F2Q68_00029901 [Brassica cretica]
MAMEPSDVEVTPPPKTMNLEAQLQDPECLRGQPNILTEEGNSARLKSIIVSPREGKEIEQEATENSLEVADDEETLRNFQSKTKTKGQRQQGSVHHACLLTFSEEQALEKENYHRFRPHQVTGGSR